MDLSFATIMWGLVFGSLGVGYFIYGKKQANGPALVTGIALCVVPYFISSLWILIPVGLALAAVPFVLDRWL
jgi:hypothetical protein